MFYVKLEFGTPKFCFRRWRLTGLHNLEHNKRWTRVVSALFSVWISIFQFYWKLCADRDVTFHSIFICMREQKIWILDSFFKDFIAFFFYLAGVLFPELPLVLLYYLMIFFRTLSCICWWFISRGWQQGIKGCVYSVWWSFVCFISKKTQSWIYNFLVYKCMYNL